MADGSLSQIYAGCIMILTNSSGPKPSLGEPDIAAQRSFRVPQKCTTETLLDGQQLLPSFLVSAVLLWCMGAMIHLENDDS